MTARAIRLRGNGHIVGALETRAERIDLSGCLIVGGCPLIPMSGRGLAYDREANPGIQVHPDLSPVRILRWLDPHVKR